jgi:hypothetical protein
MQPETAFVVTRTLVGLALVISSCEYLVLGDLFASSGLLSWRVLLQRSGLSRAARWLTPLLESGGLRWVFALRAGCGAALCLPLPMNAAALTAGIALALSLLIGYRNLVGGDGSDQMTVVVLAGLVIAGGPFDSRARMAGYVLIASQSILSYMVAGIAKAISPTWRQGDALPLILRTATYGAHRFARWCAHRAGTARALCWATIVFEILFPFAILAPTPIFVAALAGGVMFHTGIAVLMGLNVFTWAFVATYPSLIVCRAALAA